MASLPRDRLLAAPIVVLWLCVGLYGRAGYAYPTGAPKAACAEAAPQHKSRSGEKITPQTSPSPYSFTTDAKTYKAGEKITVTIQGSQTFGGFMIQARQVGGKNPVGNFSKLPSNSQLRGCLADDDGVTHTNPNPKLPEMKFTWSTKQEVGAIEFYGTVAKDHDVFWSPIKSLEIKQASESAVRHLTFGAVDEEMRQLVDEAKTRTWRHLLVNRTVAYDGILRQRRQREEKGNE